MQPLVLLGCGFAGAAAAKQALPARRVIATTRSAAHADTLVALGLDARLVPTLDADAVRALVPDGADVLVTYPPDGGDAERAAATSHARAVAYISASSVYGAASGRVDENTPAAPDSPRARARFEAEQAWRGAGAAIVRAPGIYGPGRGLHLRVAAGAWRIPGDGQNAVSRIHVDDLATICLAALARADRGAVYLAGDEEPGPQIEPVAWLCRRLGLPLPPFVPLDLVDESLRGDRRIDSAATRRALGVTLRHPTYREGFAHCLEAEAALR